MVNPMKYQFSKGYCLNLNDNNNWWITGIDDGIYQVDKFAHIMSLKECPINDFPKLVFLENSNSNDINLLKKDKSPEEANSSLSDLGWRPYKYKDANIWYHHRYDDTICEFTSDGFAEIGSSDKSYLSMWLSLQPIYRRSIKMGGLPFHSGFAGYNGKGILFSAKTNTGKSTCYRRLPDYWEPLCDDEVLVVLGEDSKYKAHPFPTWSEYLTSKSEKTWNVQHSLPLSAIFFIEQSKDDEVIPIDAAESTMLIIDSAEQVWEKYLKHSYRGYKVAFRKEALNSAINIAKAIPAYSLRVSLTGRFWEEIEKVI